MPGESTWTGLTADQIELAAEGYAAAHDHAVMMAHRMFPDDLESSARELVLLKRDIVISLGNALMSDGCPREELASWLSKIIKRVVAKRRATIISDEEGVLLATVH